MIDLIKHDCKEELRGLDLKATPIRLGILRLLETADNPVDVATIIAYLREHNIDVDPATVFRSINQFHEKGLVKEIHLNESKLRYELASQPEHHHLVCEKCGRIESIADCDIQKLEEEINKKKKFMVKKHSLEFFGLCEKCNN